MSVPKRAAFLLLLLAAIGAEAAPGPEDCHGLNITLAPKDLHQISGGWVLIWATTDRPELLVNLSSSQIGFEIHGSNATFTEDNLFDNKSCISYVIDTTLPTDPEDHTAHTFDGTMELSGAVSRFNDSATMDFFKTCDGCMNMIYKGTFGRFLLSYRREGHHQDVEQNKAAHADLETLSDCLDIPHDHPFIYDGAADLCHNKAPAATEAAPVAAATEAAPASDQS